MRVLGKIFLGLIVVVVILVGYVAWEGSSMDKEGSAYVDEAVPAIFKRWDKDELVRRLSPGFMKSTTDADLSSLFYGIAHRLGVLVRCDPAKGECRVLLTQKGLSVTGEYKVNAQFYTGPGTIEVSLVKEGGRWEIQGFNINSPVFVK